MNFYLILGVIHLVCTQNFPKKITLLVHADMQTLVFSENFAHVLNDLLGNTSITCFASHSQTKSLYPRFFNVTLNSIWANTSYPIKTPDNL